MKLSKWIFPFVFFLSIFSIDNLIHAQKNQGATNPKIDSLKILIPVSPDSVKFKIFDELFMMYRYSLLDSTEMYANKQSKLIDKLNDIPFAVDAYIIKGAIYAYLGVLDSAYSWYMRGLDLCFENNYVKGEITALICLSSIFDELGDIRKFLKYSVKALELSKYDTMKTIYCSVNVGLAYNEFEEYVNTEKVLTSAIEISKSQDYYLLHNLYNRLGIMYESQEKWDSAAFYHRLSLKNVDSDNLVHRGIYLFNIGTIMQEIDEPDYARYYFNSALQNLDNVDHVLYQSIVYNGLAQTYLCRKNYIKALPYLQKGLKISREIKAPKQILSILNDVHTVYSEINNPAKAYECLNEYNLLKDSVALKKQKTEINNKQFLDKIALAEESIISFGKQLQSSEQKRNIYFIILILCLGDVVLLIGLALILYYHLLSIKKNKELIIKIRQLSKKVIKENIEVELSEKSSTEKNSNISDAIRDKIASALLKWMQNQGYLENISIDNLAREMNTNQRYLSATIREEYNKNYTDFVNSLRIDYVLKRLQTDSRFRNITIEAIYESVGFKSRNTFYNAFKLRTGMTPYFYIKQLEATQH